MIKDNIQKQIEERHLLADSLYTGETISIDLPDQRTEEDVKSSVPEKE